jgi:hypothetical protein
MPVKSDLFRLAVTDAVAERVAIEAQAQFPQGLTNRAFESITAALMMADWEDLAERVPFAQAVDRFCGTERIRKGRQHRAQDKRRTK